MAALKRFLKRLISDVIRGYSFIFNKVQVNYWEERAKQLGPLAVLNKRHSANEIERVTEFQVSQIMPYLTPCLTGDDKTLIDFGCGTGRFMPYLRMLTSGDIIGVDPTPTLLGLAPRINGVEYRVMRSMHQIPLKSEIGDLLWICLVLGGISDSSMQLIIKELMRVAKNNCLVCLTENTSNKPNASHWTFRSKEYYESIFPGAKLNHVNDYYDFDEQISVFVGRIKATPLKNES